MGKHLLSFCIFHVCYLCQWPEQVTCPSPESVAHKNFECIIVTIYHSDFAVRHSGSTEQLYWHRLGRIVEEGIYCGVALGI